MTGLRWKRTADGLPKEDCESGEWWVCDDYEKDPLHLEQHFSRLYDWKYYCAVPMPVISPPFGPDTRLITHLKYELGRSVVHGIEREVLKCLITKAERGDFDE